MQSIPKECPGTSSTEAGAASACEGCPNQRICSSGVARLPDPDLSVLASKLASIKYKVLVLSGKGGVGKSTITSMIARALSMDENLEIGVLDVDICGPSQPRLFGKLEEKVHSSGSGWSPVYVDENLALMSVGFLLNSSEDAVIWRGPKKNGLIKQFIRDVDWGSLDYLLIDTPPGTSDEHLSIIQYLSSSLNVGAIIVTTPQEVSLQDVRKEISFCQKLKIPMIGLVENMTRFICPKCKGESIIFPPTTGGGSALCQETGLQLLGKFPLDPMIARSCDSGENYLISNLDTESGTTYRAVAQSIRDYFESSG